jgi:protein-S-isoprenylcysteine O-methyltransferase Ste14
MNSKSLSDLFFKYRSYTPLPFIVIMLIYENANIWSLIGGFIIVIIGESIRLWGVSWAGSETRTTDKPGGSYLVISGPFAHLRNPLYLGNILIYAAIGIMSFAIFPYLQIFALAFFFVQYYFIIKSEEEFLIKEYGDQYKEYSANVRRFTARITPYKVPGLKQPSFNLKSGFRSERRTLQAISIITVTIFLLWFIGRA